MENVVIDKSRRNPGKPLSSHNSFPSSLSQGSFGSRPLPYSYLPRLPSSTPFFVPASHQPPLLPLPVLRSASLPPPAKMIAATSSGIMKPRDHHQKKKRKPRKESRLSTVREEAHVVAPEQPKGAEKELEEEEEVILLAPERRVLKPKDGGEEVVVVVEAEEEKRVDFVQSVYSISPPPSSLPLPKFSLKPEAPCTVEAMGESSSDRAVDSCATDELRRLLRL